MSWFVSERKEPGEKRDEVDGNTDRSDGWRIVGVTRLLLSTRSTSGTTKRPRTKTLTKVTAKTTSLYKNTSYRSRRAAGDVFIGILANHVKEQRLGHGNGHSETRPQYSCHRRFCGIIDCSVSENPPVCSQVTKIIAFLINAKNQYKGEYMAGKGERPKAAIPLQRGEHVTVRVLPTIGCPVAMPAMTLVGLAFERVGGLLGKPKRMDHRRVDK
ncbi:hypothetical protein [Halococcus thailandensis]|uniref:hypothetical protein n=1 Tax=Halococcus thailandensis TaxID=335952 RepID=UPI00126968CB|nr:hypothetical protein [Halococcus thailandensis]